MRTQWAIMFSIMHRYHASSASYHASGVAARSVSPLQADTPDKNKSESRGVGAKAPTPRADRKRRWRYTFVNIWSHRSWLRAYALALSVGLLRCRNGSISSGLRLFSLRYRWFRLRLRLRLHRPATICRPPDSIMRNLPCAAIMQAASPRAVQKHPSGGDA